MTRGLADDLLVVGQVVELARAAARPRLADRTTPCGFFEVDTLHRLEHRGAADRCHVRERRREARSGWGGEAACVTTGVATRDEMRHSYGDRAVLDVCVQVAMADGGLRLARAKAFGDDRAKVVGDQLVERAVGVREVGR